MKASAATASLQSLLTSQSVQQADEAPDHRKQALEAQARSEAEALLSRIKTSAVSTASTLIDQSSSVDKKDDKDQKDDKAGVANSKVATAPAGSSGSGMDLVTYASVTKAYEVQTAQHSS